MRYFVGAVTCRWKFRFCGWLITVLFLMLLMLAACTEVAVEVIDNRANYSTGRETIGVVDANGTRALTIQGFASAAVYDLLDVTHHVTIIGSNGSVLRDLNYRAAQLQSNGSHIDYIAGDGVIFNNIAGVMADGPEISITQVYDYARYFLGNNERVMIILMDGWGWEMFQYFEHLQPFLSGKNPQPALAAYPPITPVSLATIITGQLPNVHGINSRNDRMINDGVTDIFALASDLGRNVVYIQGHTNPISTSVMPIFSLAVEGSYATDDVVFENARRNLDADFLFIHFHGIDDNAHAYGPYAIEVGEKMAQLDGYINYLVDNWGVGYVIIAADHGLHPVYDNPGRLGDHFKVSHEDMIVPFVQFRVG